MKTDLKRAQASHTGDNSGCKKMRSRWRLILAVALAVPLVVLLALLGYRETVQYSSSRQPTTTSPDGIETLEEIELGGVKQWILIRGVDRNQPVLLWLPGGPGVPAMPLADRYDDELTKHFVVVHWDQRGAGKTYEPGLSSSDLTTEKYLSDTHQLVERIEDRFGEERVYLVGHSWGSALGALAVKQHPEDFYAFVSLGQLVNNRESDRIAYTHALGVARERGNGEAVAALEEIGAPP